MIWGVTTYFNPCRYRCWPDNYRTFRRAFPLPLLTVELSFDGEFELGAGDAEVVVRVDGGDVLWQKERLMNHARAFLPDECSAVVLTDCDVIFHGARWKERTAALLREHPLVQPFTKVYRLPQGYEHAGCADWSRYPRFGYSIAHQMGLHGRARGALGGAWALQREVFERHGIYDACIVGSGDDAFARAAYGRFGESAKNCHFGPAQEAHYREWAEPFYEAVRGRVAFTPARLGLLWHGDYANRRYIDRHQCLTDARFDPAADIRVGPSGALRWNSDKPALHQALRQYFLDRREDEPAPAPRART